MQPRFTRAEYWILEVVVTGGWPLCYLHSDNPKDVEQMFNRRFHGLDRPKLIDCLEGLFAAGLIEASIDPGNIPPGPLNRDKIITALEEQGPHAGPSTYYHLTAKGGSQWEAFAQPDWRRFVLDESHWGTGKGRLTCMDRKWLETYVAHSSIAEGRIDEASISYQELGTWKAAYWKVLPNGYCVEFRRPWEQGMPECTPETELITRMRAFSEFCRLRNGWYRWPESSTRI